jgi:hypothetical protein
MTGRPPSRGSAANQHVMLRFTAAEFAELAQLPTPLAATLREIVMWVIRTGWVRRLFHQRLRAHSLPPAPPDFGGEV